mmetsp:Transcript_50084/g.92413  ORF Transcript_50084/g.92413 Transcript_50084/m.92413 type:complete len:311 (-) Transcript_50084:62-994(-)
MPMKLARSIFAFGLSVALGARVDVVDINLHSQTAIDATDGACAGLVKGSIETEGEGKPEGTFYDGVTPEFLKKAEQLCACESEEQRVFSVEGNEAKVLGEGGLTRGFMLGPAIFAYQHAQEVSTGKWGDTYMCMTETEAYARQFKSKVKFVTELVKDNGNSELSNSFLLIREFGSALLSAAEALKLERLGKETDASQKLTKAWYTAEEAKADVKNYLWMRDIDMCEEALKYAISFLKRVGLRFDAQLSEGTELVSEIAAILKEEAAKDSESPEAKTFFEGESFDKVKKLVKIAESMVESLTPEVSALVQK